jgi:membrane-associated protease RseP (regulator of RpoE activity)
MSIFYGLLGIGFLIFVHELGHYMAARWCRIPVLTFAVGFGPTLVSFTRRGTTYKLNLLPLGGYVTTPAEATKTSPIGKRVLYYLAGIGMNVLTAILFLTVLVSFTGIPHNEADGQVLYSRTVPLPEGLWLATKACFNMMGNILSGFLHLLTGMISWDQIGGPVQMVQQTSQASTLGLAYYLGFLATLSLNLAVLNLLPIPSLDGSHLMFTLIEFLRRGKRISLEKEAMVHFVGILAMLALMVAVTFKDLNMI